ncbi:hypothetical protein [Lysobacter sp. Hz 25]|uniref:hypothetical protein n=1 Tax=Lysobacter sp. Hz 25 TaxID=3383698 RepID=UPI0038D38E9A
MTKHLLFVIKPSSGPHLTLPIGELAAMALARLPEVRNVSIERQSRSDAVLTFETDGLDAPTNLAIRLATFGLKSGLTRRVDWLS